MKCVVICLLLTMFFLFSSLSFGQNLELSGGWAHSTGDFGVDGLGLGVALWFNRRVSIGLNYDTMWDTSRIGTFELTSIGNVSSKSHLQNFLVGPRIFFPKVKKHNISPFVEAQFGGSHLSSKIQEVGATEISTSDNAFSWQVGGGADFHLNPHWAFRGNLDLLRTHFADTGQSRIRFVLGVSYTLARRK